MIPCIHDGKKTIMNILFLGKSKEIDACTDCEGIIRSSESVCEVVV